MQDEPKKTEHAAAPKKKNKQLQGLKAEFHRIIWPDKDTVVKETTAVVVTTVILGVIIALLDWVIKLGLDRIFS
ncbi:MAG: preprotein translocase subunit SecE [Lachnospiraceae bacterium]|nr:preprotein translocase subunit SecE [Lachnospiraceae bacterium]